MSCDAQCQGANDFCTGYDIWFQNPKNIVKKSMILVMSAFLPLHLYWLNQSTNFSNRSKFGFIRLRV